MIQLKVKRLRPNAIMPTRAYPSDSGWDCYAANDSHIWIGARAVVVPLGIAVEAPRGYEVQVRPRSSLLARRGLHCAFGTTDNGYRGELCAVLCKVAASERSFIEPGERVCQLVVVPVPEVELVESAFLSDSERGGAGFGSTGR